MLHRFGQYGEKIGNNGSKAGEIIGEKNTVLYWQKFWYLVFGKVNCIDLSKMVEKIGNKSSRAWRQVTLFG